MDGTLNIAPASINEDDAAHALDKVRDLLKKAQDIFVAAKFPGSVAQQIGNIDYNIDAAVEGCGFALKKIGATDVR